jgi:hypothetical protein
VGDCSHDVTKYEHERENDNEDNVPYNVAENRGLIVRTRHPRTNAIQQKQDAGTFKNEGH